MVPGPWWGWTGGMWVGGFRHSGTNPAQQVARQMMVTVMASATSATTNMVSPPHAVLYLMSVSVHHWSQHSIVIISDSLIRFVRNLIRKDHIMRGAYWFFFLVATTSIVAGISFLITEQGRPELSIMGDAATICFGNGAIFAILATLTALVMRLGDK